LSTRNSLLLLFCLFSLQLFSFHPKVVVDNLLYKQLKIEIDENKRRINQEEKNLPVQFFTYELDNLDTIFTVSSRFNLPYDTIATLNGIDNQLFFSSFTEILIPTCQGIYLKQELYDNPQVLDIDGSKIYFYPARNFSGKERLNFLKSPFNEPIKNMIITSPFGYRENPFSGKREFHLGLDLKAYIGTKVYAPYNGVIEEVTFSNFYGNTLVINHGSGYTSRYYHLNKIVVKKGNKINKGDYIAQTGNTGRSTGPHLHFEIRLNDEPIDPKKLLGKI